MKRKNSLYNILGSFAGGVIGLGLSYKFAGFMAHHPLNGVPLAGLKGGASLLLETGIIGGITLTNIQAGKLIGSSLAKLPDHRLRLLRKAMPDWDVSVSNTSVQANRILNSHQTETLSVILRFSPAQDERVVRSYGDVELMPVTEYIGGKPVQTLKPRRDLKRAEIKTYAQLPSDKQELLDLMRDIGMLRPGIRLGRIMGTSKLTKNRELAEKLSTPLLERDKDIYQRMGVIPTWLRKPDEFDRKLAAKLSMQTKDDIEVYPYRPTGSTKPGEPA